MLQFSATAEELLAVVKQMFPTEYDRATAELTIRKQTEEIQRLKAELARHDADAPDDANAA